MHTHTKRIAFFVAILLTIPAITGSLAESEGPLRVTATFYPLYVAALNVFKDVPGITLSSLAPPAAGCLHDYQISTSDRQALAETDVLLINGAGLETFLDKLLPQLSATVIDTSAGSPLLEASIGEHGEVNPHIWVSLDGMIWQVRRIAKGMAEADPAHAAQYDANAAAYIEKLSALREEMLHTLAPLAGSPIVTFHEAFAYFAEEFGLRVVATVHNHEGMAPSARNIAMLSDLIRTEDVHALFAEPQYSDTSIDLLSRETGVPVFILDPAVTGEINPADTDAYLRIMRQNMDTLVEALS